MIKRTPVKGSNEIKVTFVVPEDRISCDVSVVGDFNGWDPLRHPLKRRSNQTRSAVVVLPPGAHAFRYLDERGRWHDEPNADAIVDNGSGATNSVVQV